MADRIAVMSAGRVQQIDTPVDLYQRPRTMFVADFIGSSNTFAGNRVDAGIDVDGVGILPGHAPWPLATSLATLVVRPEDIEICEPAAALLAGVVIDIQFYGGSSTIAVHVDGHATPIIVTCQGTTAVERGAQVHLAWSPEKAVILGEEA